MEVDVEGGEVGHLGASAKPCAGGLCEGCEVLVVCARGFEGWFGRGFFIRVGRVDRVSGLCRSVECGCGMSRYARSVLEWRQFTGDQL